jgi:hypothetical protein
MSKCLSGARKAEHALDNTCRGLHLVGTCFGSPQLYSDQTHRPPAKAVDDVSKARGWRTRSWADADAADVGRRYVLAQESALVADSLWAHMRCRGGERDPYGRHHESGEGHRDQRLGVVGVDES